MFSKIVLGAVLATYFVGLMLGIFVVIHILNNYPEYAVQAFLGILSYIGAPVAVSIAFYSWKAKNENMAKIANSEEPE